jgi:hypothetical protein
LCVQRSSLGIQTFKTAMAACICLTACSYDMHSKYPLKFEYARDQSQVAPVRLLNIAGNAIPASRQLAAHMADQTGLKVCQSFKDPYTVWVRGVLLCPVLCYTVRCGTVRCCASASVSGVLLSAVLCCGFNALRHAALCHSAASCGDLCPGNLYRH